MKPLKPRWETFAREYLVDLNASRAARAAGYSGRTSGTTGTRLRRNPAIKAFIDAVMAERARRLEVAADRVLKEYARIAFADVRKYFKLKNETLEPCALTELSDDEAAAIAEVGRIGSADGPRLRLYDKQPALDALARHLGLFGWNGMARTGDIRSAAQDRARAILKERIERVMKEREKGGETVAAAPATPALKEG